MASVAIHPPKTPVTKGSKGISKATLPNVCKMPGPPAPFVPAPLPNIAKSGSSPKDYSNDVKIEGNTVAIRGAMFESIGDMASKGTGGGLISANCHGPAKFVTPGSMTVKIEGKSVHLLGEPMLNNCGPSGSPPNTGATMSGVLQDSKEKNPTNEDFCGAGNHTERIHHPEVPKNEWKPEDRLEAMRANAKTPEDLFEVAAAAHNVKAGHITHGNQLSRNISPKEKAAGSSEDDQKIWAICIVCSHRREIDQAPDRDSTVEAKSTADAVTGGKQKQNNAALLARGKSVTYKAPWLGIQKVNALIEAGFKFIPI